MTQITPIYSLSLNARATLDLHSLNNEGGEGNQIQTRMVNIVDQHGQMHNVNAVSGDMYKHIHAEHMFRIATSRTDLPLCAGCRTFNANRINADADFIRRTKSMNDAATVDELLRTCTLDDAQGILITEGNRSVPRKSVIEFGWVVGVPGSVGTDSYFHVKYANERSEGRRGEDREGTASTGANLGQSIFHRPASSGIYAAVCHVELARIGFNDITQTYAIDEQQRAARARAVLEALLYTFLETRGAMRSAQAPHMVNLEGVLTVSTAPVPAPTVSPLNDGYIGQIEQTVEMLNRINGNVVGLYGFDATAGLANVIADLLETTAPYSLRYATGA
jgi:CRISPR-associated protein Cst2